MLGYTIMEIKLVTKNSSMASFQTKDDISSDSKSEKQHVNDNGGRERKEARATTTQYSAGLPASMYWIQPSQTRNSAKFSQTQ